MNNSETEKEIIRDRILETIFLNDISNNIIGPKFKDFIDAKDILLSWELFSEYEDYSYEEISNLIKDSEINFFANLNEINFHRQKEKDAKKYSYKTLIKFELDYEILRLLQRLAMYYCDSNVLYKKQVALFKANISTKDTSSIEIVLGFDISFLLLKKHLESNLDVEHHEEISLFIEALKQAQEDKHDTLYVYAC